MALQCRIFSVQYGGIMNLVVFNLGWLLSVNPFIDQSMNYLEKFNESFLLGSLYCLPLFTDWVTDPKVQYWYGWIFVGTLAPLFLTNIGYVLMLAVTMVSQKLKKKSAAKKLAMAQAKSLTAAAENARQEEED